MKLLALFAFLLGVTALHASPPAAEIESLLTYVRGLEGCAFIRNGTEHSAPDAASHLRMKWEKQRAKVRTAEEFIALCASKSSMSGERYQIRFKDGRLAYADDVLGAELARLRNSAAEART
jgi:hypothetical protein